MHNVSDSSCNKQASSVMVLCNSSRTPGTKERASTYMSSCSLLMHPSPLHGLTWFTQLIVSVSILLRRTILVWSSHPFVTTLTLCLITPATICTQLYTRCPIRNTLSGWSLLRYLGVCSYISQRGHHLLSSQVSRLYPLITPKFYKPVHRAIREQQH